MEQQWKVLIITKTHIYIYTHICIKLIHFYVSLVVNLLACADCVIKIMFLMLKCNNNHHHHCCYYYYYYYPQIFTKKLEKIFA